MKNKFLKIFSLAFFLNLIENLILLLIFDIKITGKTFISAGLFSLILVILLNMVEKK